MGQERAGELLVVPIGHVRGGRVEPEDDGWDAEEAVIELDPRFGPESLFGLADFSHVEVVYRFHLVDEASVVPGARHPRGREDWPLVGIFAQRGRVRPNRLGVSVCALLGVDGTTVRVRGLDAIDGTPVLDLKPVMREFLPRGEVVQPAWSTELMARYWACRVKRIGLLGGMSWESSIEYERIINEEVRARLGGVHSADLVIRSFDFAAIEALQARGGWEEAGRVLAEAAVALEGAGAELLVLCTNTMHAVADAITDATTVPLLHIADATATAVQRAGVRTVALLGTRYTMEQPFYRDRMVHRHGLDVRIPTAEERAAVHDVIYDELVRGVVRDASRDRYLAIVGRMVADGCEGVIAGCTEIELLVRPDHVTVPYFPSTRLHALAAVDAALT